MIPRNLVISVAVMLAVALGMGFYVWHTRGKAPTVSVTTATQPIAPPASGPTEAVTLYLADDEQGSLRATTARISLPSGRQERALEILRALVAAYLDKSSTHALAAGAEVREVYLVEPGLAVIDINSAFADGHRFGVLVEELTVTSMIESLAANVPGITQVRFLIDGKDRETLAGHVDLTHFFETSQVSQLAAQIAEGN